MDKINHWTFIRRISPDLVTIHSSRLFPDDKVFTYMMTFLRERVTMDCDVETPFEELLSKMVGYVATKAGILHSYVSKLLQCEKTATQEGYKNVLEGVLTIRMGCTVSNGKVRNLKINEPNLAIGS